jgi:DNA-binding beta-propeller fold protein YncE
MDAHAVSPIFTRMFRISRRLLVAAMTGAFLLLVLYACKHQPAVSGVPDGNYPPEVNRIFLTRCANAGCHNAASYDLADGVRLDTWDHLFDGSAHGAVVIPYDVENSSLLQFINVDHNLGHTAEPTMPYNSTPLSRDEFLTIKNWVAAGAPDKNGNIPFAADPDTRQKIYMTMQGCDIVSVIDAERKVIMRNIKVGKTNAIEAPHFIQVSPDGQYAYTCFLAGNFLQKIDTRTDAIVGETDISAGLSAQWNVLHVSDDGTKVIAADFLNGMFKIINTATMQVVQQISGSGLFNSPHGIAANTSFDTLYVTAQYGNVVYKIYPNSGSYKKISIDGAPLNYNHGARDPHDIKMLPDGSKYFLTCEASDEVRVMDARADTLIHVFDVPTKPQEMAVSRKYPYLFVTCMEAASGQAKVKGAVVVIDYVKMEKVATIYGPFYQPHGITVDDRNGVFYVASANVDTGGVAPHHVSICAGTNGWYSVYDLQTLKPVTDVRYETSVYPYSADARFK